MPAGRHRARPARAALPGAQPRPARPRLRPARRPQPASQLRRSLRGLQRGGLPPRLRAARRPRRSRRRRSSGEPLWNDRRDEHGPFDIIGDVHGCCDELEALLDAARLRASRPRRRPAATGRRATPTGRKAVFVGDLVDRGPRHRSTCCGWCMDMVAAGTALCVPGNHDMKLLRKLRGRERPDHPRPGRDAGRDRRPARRGRRTFRTERRRVPRRPGQPLRPRRRQAGRRPRRA